MKPVVSLLFSAALAASQAPAATGVAPYGNLLELHSCELYAGGCTVSSEATLGGRYLLRAWQIAGGEFAGQDLAGLQVALLQSGAENLAFAKASAAQSVLYLPDTATPGARQALVAWVKSICPDLGLGNVQTRVLPLRFESSVAGSTFSAGSVASVQTAALESCDTGSCGEALWYTPRASTSLFTVAVNRTSEVTEPLLQLHWADSGKRSVFLARFGAPAQAKDLYVTTADLCGPNGKLF